MKIYRRGMKIILTPYLCLNIVIYYDFTLIILKPRLINAKQTFIIYLINSYTDLPHNIPRALTFRGAQYNINVVSQQL